MTRRVLFSALVLLAIGGTACGRYLTAGVAVVNGVSVSKAEFDKQFAAISSSQQFSGAFDPNNPQQKLDVERQIIVSLIQQELIRQEGERLRIAVTDAQVDQGLLQVQTQFQTPEQFQAALAQNKLTIPELRAQVKNQILLQRVRDRVTAGQQATEEEIRASYGDGSKFEEIRVRHIFFRVAGSNAASQRRKAEAALAKLKAGADFATIAKQESEDPGSKAKGGDLGYITRDVQFDQQFLQAAFALKKGQLSGIVQSSLGYHIIRVDDRRTKTLKQEHSQLAQQITTQKQQKAFQDYLRKVIASAHIDVNPRYGDFNPQTLQINDHQFFVPPTPTPQTQPFVVP